MFSRILIVYSAAGGYSGSVVGAGVMIMSVCLSVCMSVSADRSDYKPQRVDKKL